MNDIERRALYNLLRMNWLSDRNLSVDSWQVEDYRTLPLFSLFDRLKPFNIYLDRVSFIAFADECDSPEDLTDHLIADRDFDATKEDQIYLLIFELWRRLMNEKPSLSIMCNELDYQIYLYDNQELENPLALQDALTHFIHILEENVDQGIPEEQAFKLISAYCANDIETFLYDFIAEQIDEENESYAYELLDDLGAYLKNNKWFKLLNIRICEKHQNKIAQKISLEIIEEHLNEQDLDYNLEFISLLAELGDHDLLEITIKQTLPLIKHEEEFKDLLGILIDYFHFIDQEPQEKFLKQTFENRSHIPFDTPFNAKDPDSFSLIQIFNNPSSLL